MMAGLHIQTDRLELVCGTADMLRADIYNRAALARMLGATVPPTWPPPLINNDVLAFAATRLAASADQAGWWTWYFIHRGMPDRHRTLIGIGGFKGGPAPDGTVEVGYGLLAAYHNRGYASEALDGLLGWAFAQPAVTCVVARTLPTLHASIRVLEKNGFTAIRRGPEAGVLRFVLLRDAYLNR